MVSYTDVLMSAHHTHPPHVQFLRRVTVHLPSAPVGIRFHLHFHDEEVPSAPKYSSASKAAGTNGSNGSSSAGIHPVSACPVYLIFPLEWQVFQDHAKEPL